MSVIETIAKPRWTRKPKARPEEVLEAALDLFARDGFAATRMDDIAKAAGMSKAAIYLYFPSKEDVFKALVETRIVKLRMEAVDIAQSSKADPIEGLRRVITLWAASNADQRMIALPRIILAESARFPELAEYYHRVAIRQLQLVLIELLEAGIAMGRFRAFDPRIAAKAFVAPMMFEMLRRQAFVNENNDIPFEDISQAFFELFLNGILNEPAAKKEGNGYE